MNPQHPGAHLGGDLVTVDAARDEEGPAVVGGAGLGPGSPGHLVVAASVQEELVLLEANGDRVAARPRDVGEDQDLVTVLVDVHRGRHHGPPVQLLGGDGAALVARNDLVLGHDDDLLS
jgi:hypothetical protein